jgi:hypothetical protein
MAAIGYVLLIVFAVALYIFIAVANWFISSWLADDVIKASGFLDVALKVVFFCIIGSVIHGSYRSTRGN